MHRAWVRRLFAVGAFAPIVIMICMSAWLSTTFLHLKPAEIESMFRSNRDLTPLYVCLGITVGIAFWQMIMAAIAGIHAAGRVDLSSGAKVAWTFACLFVGSLGLPLFVFIVLPGAERAAQLKAQRPGPMGPHATGGPPGAYPMGGPPMGGPPMGGYPPR